MISHSAKKGLRHALTCWARRRYLRWRWHMPFWREDKVAQMLGIADRGCPRCGRGSVIPPGMTGGED